jgi:hypothetical protein
MYLGTSINESPVIAGVAGAAITGADFLAVKFSAGKIVPCSVAGELAYGVIIPGTGDVAIGDDVTVQRKDIGLAKAGGVVAVGDELTVTAAGKVVKAIATNYVLGYALQAGADGTIIKIEITKSGYKPA